MEHSNFPPSAPPPEPFLFELHIYGLIDRVDHELILTLQEISPTQLTDPQRAMILYETIQALPSLRQRDPEQ